MKKIASDPTAVSLFEAEFYKIHSKEVNPHNFKFIINPGNDICRQSPVFLLVYVHSAPENQKNRMVLRETWLNENLFPEIKHVFLTGESNISKTNSLLKLESEIYNDIVQEDFVDTYYNLTLKSVMAMKWIAHYCERAQFVLKVDDDMLVNMFSLVKHLKAILSYQEVNHNNLIMCNLFKRAKVMRNPRSKWYVSQNDFKSPYFREYCSGSAFIFAGNLARQLFYGATRKCNKK